jgi:hypothetical protein
MKKNTCPHCGAWGQLSRFCSRCGNSIIYKDLESGQKDFQDKPIAKSTQIKDSAVAIWIAICLTILITVLISF